MYIILKINFTKNNNNPTTQYIITNLPTSFVFDRRGILNNRDWHLIRQIQQNKHKQHITEVQFVQWLPRF